MTDIVGYSKKDGPDQAACVKRLLETWFALSPPANYRALPTGDGFIGVLPLGDGGDVPVWLLDLILQLGETVTTGSKFEIRLGLHIGDALPIHIDDQLSFDPKANQLTANNFISYHINYVARLVSCANPGQIIASHDFVQRVGTILKTNPHYSIWRDKFVVAFKGDEVSFSSPGTTTVKPGMAAAQQFSEDARDVHSLVIFREDKKYGNMTVPGNAVHYVGTNTYHNCNDIGRHLGRTIFQRLPDIELFQLYENEPQIPLISRGPFFVRLPFKILYDAAEGRVLDIRTQTTDDEMTWGVAEDGDWIEKSLGKPKENNELCSLSAYDPLPDGSIHLAYARCWYAQSLATVISPDRCPGNDVESSLRRILLRDASSLKKILPRHRDPRLTAHMGVSAIVFTSEGCPLIQIRGSENLHSNINSESASASGAVDWADWVGLQSESDFEVDIGQNKKLIITHKRLLELFRGRKLMPADRAIIREAAEEIGLSPDDIRSVKLVGIAREFRRVGKPEFFLRDSQ